MAVRSGARRARDLTFVLVPVLLIIGALVWVALRFADPAPPKTFVIASASKDSPYHRMAARYQPLFSKNGVTLENRESDGSIANFKSLNDKSSGVHAAFVQGGLFSSKDSPDLVSLGRVAHEPLWVFTSEGAKIERIADLKGRKVLVGPAGGGTNGLALRLLAANGITAENATLITSQLPDYVDKLAKGEADAGFLVLAAEARTIQRLFATPGVKLMSFANADAYTQKFPFLTRLDLREGAVDLGKRIPAQDTVLLATSAAIVVRRDAHPALVNLLAQAVHDVHGNPSVDASGQTPLFQRAGEFPTSSDPEFPFSEEARTVYRSGPPFLQRYMPFWVSTMLDRLRVTLLVALPLLIPLVRIGPAAYKWRIRRRLLKWYDKLKQLENRSKVAASPDDRATQLAELDGIEAAVDEIPIPFGYTDQHLELRQHIDSVRGRIMGRLGREGLTSGAPQT